MEGARNQQGLQGQMLAERSLMGGLYVQTVPPWCLVPWEALREDTGGYECLMGEMLRPARGTL